MRAAATQAAGEAFKQAQAEPPQEPPQPEKSVCHVGLVFALGIEAGGLVDRLAGVIKIEGAGFVAREGGLGGKRLVLIESGAGREAAGRATEALIAGHEPRWVISAGFAGALDERLKQGDMLMADAIVDASDRQLAIDFKLGGDSPRVHVGRLLTVDRVIRDPAEKRALGARHGALAVDMESIAVADACRAAGVRFLSVRVIIDDVDQALPRDIDLMVKKKSTAGMLGAAAGAISAAHRASRTCGSSRKMRSPPASGWQSFWPASWGNCPGRSGDGAQRRFPISAARQLLHNCKLRGAASFCPVLLFPTHCSWFAHVSLPARRAICTSAECARHSSTGCSRGAMAANSCCGSTTRMPSGTSMRRWRPILHGFRWLGIDWDEGPEVGGPYRAVLPIAAIAALSNGRRDAAGRRDWPIAISPRPRRFKPSAKRPRPRSVRFSTAAAGWPRRLRRKQQFEAEGRQSVVRLKMPREGTLVIDDLVRGRVEFEWAREQDHVIQRTDGTCLYHLASVGGRSRFRHHARDPRRGASVEHAAADFHRPVARLRAAAICRICPTWPSRGARTSSASGSWKSI